MRFFFFSLLSLVFMAVCFLIIVYVHTNIFRVQKVHFYTDQIPEGKTVHIIQVADLHNKFFDSGNRRLLDKIHQLRPDVIVITGDFIDARTKDISDVLGFGEGLAKETQVYFVPGNHEWRNKHREKLIKGLQDHHIGILSNTHTTISLGDIKINIAGVDDFYSNHEDVQKALKGLNRDYYTILLSHDPMIINKPLANVDLVLSGHTHGGQIRIPFLGAVIVPGQKSLPQYDRGVYTLSNGANLYIDSGLGTSVFPVRFWCRAQVSMITLVGTGK